MRSYSTALAYGRCVLNYYLRSKKMFTILTSTQWCLNFCLKLITADRSITTHPCFPEKTSKPRNLSPSRFRRSVTLIALMAPISGAGAKVPSVKNHRGAAVYQRTDRPDRNKRGSVGLDEERGESSLFPDVFHTTAQPSIKLFDPRVAHPS